MLSTTGAVIMEARKLPSFPTRIDCEIDEITKSTVARQIRNMTNFGKKDRNVGAIIQWIWMSTVKHSFVLEEIWTQYKADNLNDIGYRIIRDQLLEQHENLIYKTVSQMMTGKPCRCFFEDVRSRLSRTYREREGANSRSLFFITVIANRKLKQNSITQEEWDFYKELSA